MRHKTHQTTSNAANKEKKTFYSISSVKRVYNKRITCAKQCLQVFTCALNNDPIQIMMRVRLCCLRARCSMYESFNSMNEEEACKWWDVGQTERQKRSNTHWKPNKIRTLDKYALNWVELNWIPAGSRLFVSKQRCSILAPQLGPAVCECISNSQKKKSQIDGKITNSF